MKKIAKVDDILPQKNIDSAHEQEYEHGDGDNQDSNNTNTDTVTKAESSYAFAPQNLHKSRYTKIIGHFAFGYTNKRRNRRT